MVSDVGNIEPPKPGFTREAETADARLQMRHKDPEYHKNNKKKKKKGSDTPINVTNSTENTISIDAIYDFLSNIAQSNAYTGNSTDKTFEELPDMFHTMATNKLRKIRNSYESAKAANAYEHAAHTAQNTNTHNIDKSNKDSLGLKNISNKQLYTLIKDIDSLRKQGVQTLSIRKKSNFLKSLILAVEEENAHKPAS